jgi:hypothetical protein
LVARLDTVTTRRAPERAEVKAIVGSVSGREEISRKVLLGEGTLCVHGWIRKRTLLYRWLRFCHTRFLRPKTRCSSYVCPGSSCHTYGQNISTEYQCLYYIVSYYKNLLQVQKGLNSGMNLILPQVVDRGFRTTRRNLHQRTPHPLSSRT